MKKELGGETRAIKVSQVMKKYLFLLLIVVSLVLVGLSVAKAEAPEPNCVCAECEKPCGSGHATWCSSYSK